MEANSCISLIIEESELFRMYLEFRCSELGDSSWSRTLRTLALNDYKDIVSNMISTQKVLF